MDDEVDPRDELLSWGFGACLGASNPFDIVDFCLGGFVIRRALLTDLLVSLHFVRKRVWVEEQDLLYHVCHMRILAFCLSFDTCETVWPSPIALCKSLAWIERGRNNRVRVWAMDQHWAGPNRKTDFIKPEHQIGILMNGWCMKPEVELSSKQYNGDLDESLTSRTSHPLGGNQTWWNFILIN